MAKHIKVKMVNVSELLDLLDKYEDNGVEHINLIVVSDPRGDSIHIETFQSAELTGIAVEEIVDKKLSKELLQKLLNKI